MFLKLLSVLALEFTHSLSALLLSLKDVIVLLLIELFVLLDVSLLDFLFAVLG